MNEDKLIAPLSSPHALSGDPESVTLDSCFRRNDTLNFANSNPLEIEIGCGKGKFLVASAAAHPDRNFLGIDRVGKWMKAGIKRGGRLNLPNFHFVKAEIREFLQAVPREAVAGFHIYFPDPWPKRRHRKRRLVNGPFLRMLFERLQSGGFILLATDDEDYFNQIRNAVIQDEALWTWREQKNQRFAYELMKTNYELKFEAVGRELYYLELKKSPTSLRGSVATEAISGIASPLRDSQ